MKSGQSLIVLLIIIPIIGVFLLLSQQAFAKKNTSVLPTLNLSPDTLYDPLSEDDIIEMNGGIGKADYTELDFTGMVTLNDGEASMRYDLRTGVLKDIKCHYSDTHVTDVQEAFAEMMRLRDLFGIPGEAVFRETNEETRPDGVQEYSFVQLYNDAEVEDGRFTAGFLSEGIPSFVYGSYVHELDNTTLDTPVLTAEDCIKKNSLKESGDARLVVIKVDNTYEYAWAIPIRDKMHSTVYCSAQTAEILKTVPGVITGS